MSTNSERLPEPVPPKHIALHSPFNGDGWRRIVLTVVLIVLAMMAFNGKTIVNNFSLVHWEDTAFIRHNRATIQSVSDCFVKPSLWPGLYRPITTNLYYYLSRRLFDNRIEWHHAINALLYLLNGLLLYAVCLRLFEGSWAMAPPLLYVSRLAHVEVVSNTCEIQALLCVFFLLVAFNLFLLGRQRKSVAWELVSLVPFSLALLSKETAVVYPAFLIAFYMMFESRSAWSRYVAPIGVVALWGVLFLTILGAIGGHRETGFGYDCTIGNLTHNLSAYLLMFCNLLVIPLDNVVLAPRVAELASNTVVRFAVAGLAVLSLVWIVRPKRIADRHTRQWKLAAQGFAIFVCGCAPFIILESRLFMRYGYLAHIGLAISVAAVLCLSYEAIRGLFGRRR